MRLKTGIWVAALLRRCNGEGKFGAVLHHGADEAGALYIYINHLDGSYDLLGPPPGPAHDEDGQRHFIKEFVAPVSWGEASAVVARRRKFDPDLWAVEIEDKTGIADLKLFVEKH